MSAVFKSVLVFSLVFGFFTLMIPRARGGDEEIVEAVPNEAISEAIEKVVFYSSFNYQTLTQDKLNRLTADFYLPTTYQDIDISYQIVSDYLSIGKEPLVISPQAGDISVYLVSLIKTPNVIQGDQSFEIIAFFDDHGTLKTYTYTGKVIPVMPDDFWGGSLYTLVSYAGMFIEGALRTMGIALIGTVIGFMLALFLTTARLLERRPEQSFMQNMTSQLLSGFAKTYVTIFRGTPMIVQASFFWYGFGLFGNPLYCGLFVVSLNTAAYIAEIIRGAIQAIDKGQTEAALSVGLGYGQLMLFVIFPQAIKNAMPAIGNEFVINIKDTAVLSVIGIFELFNQTRKITGMHYRQLEAYAITALIYLGLTYLTTKTLHFVERKMDMVPVALVSSN